MLDDGLAKQNLKSILDIVWYSSDYKRFSMGNLFSADDYVPMEIRKENNIYMYHHSQHT